MLIFVATLLAALALSSATTPFCDVCTCSSTDNSPPTVNCTSKEISNIFEPRLWTDAGNTSYSIQALITGDIKLGNLTAKFPTSDLRVLDLSGNAIVKMGPGVFGGLQKMSILVLAHNEIDYVDPDIFRGDYTEGLFYPLRALRLLDLSYNELHTLHADTFEHVDELEQLDLSHNPFKVLDAQTVQAIASLVFLQTLSLSFAQLKTLPENFLRTPRFLTALDLTGNSFEAVPSALEHSGVSTLNFSENHLTALRSNEPLPATLRCLRVERSPELRRIYGEAFAKSANLTELLLGDNPKLTYVDADRWTATTVVLRNCNVSTLPEGLFADASRLDLDNNPWICNCSIEWLTEIANLTCQYRPKMACRYRDHHVVELIALCVLMVVFMLFLVLFIRRRRRAVNGFSKVYSVLRDEHETYHLSE